MAMPKELYIIDRPGEGLRTQACKSHLHSAKLQCVDPIKLMCANLFNVCNSVQCVKRVFFVLHAQVPG